MTLYIGPIVEGYTEVDCLDKLLHRIWNEIIQSHERLQVLPRSRGSRSALIDLKLPDLGNKVNESFDNLQKFLNRDRDGRGFLLLLLDAEEDCPMTLAPALLKSAMQARTNASISCVLAKRMIENWIVAGASPLAGLNGLPEELPIRDQFEDRNGESWLDVQMRKKNPAQKYKKTSDAKVFFQHIDLAECRQNSPSFDKLCRELETWTQ